MTEESLYTVSATVRIRKGQGRALKSGGAWVYDNEIEAIEGSFENGGLVNVEDFDGYPLGCGFINTRSHITVRMLSRKKNQVINREFFRMRLKNAWEYRKATVDTASCRIVFGEADFLPGIVIDKFSDVLVVESLALGIDRLKPVLLELLQEILAQDGVHIRGIYERNDAKVRLLEGMERVKGLIGPAFETKVEIMENGVRYLVDVKDGQKTGFFLDQKYNRSGHSESVPPHSARNRARLLHPHRFFCPKRRSGRGKACAGRGCLGAGRAPGRGKCGSQRPFLLRLLPVRRCI